MNDYNSSAGSQSAISAAMNSNSNDTAQFNLQGLRKYNISLRANRVNGEYFQAIEGDFLYISRADIPCSISVIRMDGGHEILACEGDEYHGAFKGLWITHVDTSGVGGTAPLTLTVLAGTGESFCNTLGNKTGPRFPQGGLLTNNLVLNGYTGINFWLPDNVRQVDDLIFYSTVVLGAASASDFTGFVNFSSNLNNGLAVIANSAAITANSNTYNTNVGPAAACKCDFITLNAAAFTYRVGFRMSGIKIPSYARQVNAKIFVGNLNTLVSATTTFTASTGDVASCYVS